MSYTWVHEDEFWSLVKLFPNPGNQFDGRMFETYGRDLEMVLEHNGPIWTLIEEDGVQIIIPGFHLVNRLGYYLGHGGQNCSLATRLIENNQ